MEHPAAVSDHPPTSRLAPSPTGALHLGNARTFLVNWAMSRQRGWRLVLRIEDLDTPRVKPGAVESMLQTLHWLGITWDRWEGLAEGQTFLTQSQDLAPYTSAMRILAARGLVYPCDLTRTQIEGAASAPQEGSHDVRFPPELRPADAGQPLDFDEVQARAPGEGLNWRLLVRPGDVEIDDQFAGRRTFSIAEIVGDFVLWTKRQQPSYQLAVVVDDDRQGVTQVVRGDDLLDSAARQLLLYRGLHLGRPPAYTHLPLVLGPDGKRLAKRHGDTRVETYRLRGVPAEAVIGLIARWSGVTSERRTMGSQEFLESFRLSTMPRSATTFTPEDDAWLLAQASRLPR